MAAVRATATIFVNQRRIVFFLTVSSLNSSTADIISCVRAHKSLLIDQDDDNLGYECSHVILILFTVFGEHLVH